MSVADDIIAAAERELGVKEEPLGSNRGKRVGFYQSLTWLPGSGWPWCVAFAWEYVVWHSVLKKPCPYKTASVAQLEAWARREGWAVKGPPKKGDLLCLNHGEHVTICHAAGSFEGGYVRCIGGNQRHQVCIVTYRAADVTTIIRVPRRVGTPNPTKPPKFEIVRGEGGQEKKVYVSGIRAALQAAGNALRAGARNVRIRRK